MAAATNSTPHCNLGQAPDINSMNISKSISVAIVPRSPATMKAAKNCCGSNPVNIWENCTLWCEIPESYINGTTGSHSDRQSQVGEEWLSCLETTMNFTGITGVRLAAAPLAGPPSLAGLGLLVLGVSSVISILG